MDCYLVLFPQRKELEAHTELCSPMHIVLENSHYNLKSWSSRVYLRLNKSINSHCFSTWTARINRYLVQCSLQSAIQYGDRMAHTSPLLISILCISMVMTWSNTRLILTLCLSCVCVVHETCFSGVHVSYMIYIASFFKTTRVNIGLANERKALYYSE